VCSFAAQRVITDNTPHGLVIRSESGTPRGSFPVIAQEAATGDVLMFAWMDREALRKTAETGRAVYFSRSRGKLWFKGEESGHVQQVHEIRLDCDNDVVLLKVTQQGHEPVDRLPYRPPQLFLPALQGRCVARRRAGLERPRQHLQVSPMDRSRLPGAPAGVIESRKPANGGDPEASYVARLLHKGPDAFLKKNRRGSTEVVMAAKDVDHGGDSQKLVGRGWPTCGSTA
jgi:phosphoribosyl-AMP cyclohydrolase